MSAEWIGLRAAKCVWESIIKERGLSATVHQLSDRKLGTVIDVVVFWRELGEADWNRGKT